MYYKRHIEGTLLESLGTNPVTAILGPRQCGKSTLAKKVLEKCKDHVYLDLERPSDLEKLNDAEWFFNSNKGKILCIDEIQRKPELFPIIRSITDDWGSKGAFLILGSASRNLIQQSSETLAGRIRYLYLSPLLFSEVKNDYTLNDFLVRGGFPRSLLARNDKESFQWREDFITAFLERDLLLWSGFSPQTMRRLWQMLAHVNGQSLNFSSLGNSIGVSHNTVRNYVELLSETFMLTIVPSYFMNTKKRLVKAPKIFLTDQGILNSLLRIADFNQLSGHPVMGSLWESVVLSNLKNHLPGTDFYYYRTSHGAEIDFICVYGNKMLAIECKATVSPSVSKGTYISMQDLNIQKLIVIAPINEGWKKSENTIVASLHESVDIFRDELQLFS